MTKCGPGLKRRWSGFRGGGCNRRLQIPALGSAIDLRNVALPEAYSYHAQTIARMPERYCEGVAARLLMGRDVSADSFLGAQRDRAALRTEVDAALAHCDALVLPTLPIPAPLLGAITVRVDGREEPVRPMMLRLTQVFNLSGHPALSLPCGITSQGLRADFRWWDGSRRQAGCGRGARMRAAHHAQSISLC